jgi:Protein of unknown function (DUF2946)
MAKRIQTSRTDRSGRTERLRWRDVLSACLLAAIALQGVLAQGHSHTHSQGPGAGVVTVGDAAAASPDGHERGRTPRNDSASCSLCQSLGAGAAPLASAVRLLLPVPEAGFEPGYVGAPAVQVGAVSYFWTPRGPPSPAPLQA